MDKSTENILITGGILAIVYFGIVRPITNGLGLTTSAADAAQQNAQNAALQQMQDAVKIKHPPKVQGNGSPLQIKFIMTFVILRLMIIKQMQFTRCAVCRITLIWQC